MKDEEKSHLTLLAMTKAGHFSSRPRQVARSLLGEEEKHRIPAFGFIVYCKADSSHIGSTIELAIAKDERSLACILRIDVNPEHDLG